MGSSGVGGVVRRGSAAALLASSAVAGSAASSAFGVRKSKQLVRSPQTARRQDEMFGSSTPKRLSINRMIEDLRIHEATARERRDDIERDARAKTIGTPHQIIALRGLFALGTHEVVFVSRVDG